MSSHSALSPLDLQRLQEALALAETSFGLTEPNPRVGCVLAAADGRVIGRGATQEAGGAHAEVMALRDAAAAGDITKGGTAWVTLEPCAHHGRTPPCCDALAAAGLARVVIAIGDPFPQVAGAGIGRLRAAGIRVDLADPAVPAEAAIRSAAYELNIGFFSRVQRGRPWVRVKVAASLDGLTALPDGRSQWITGEAARTDGHAFRRRAGAVLTGIGTVRADDPRLDVRLVPTPRQPLRVVLDSGLTLPAQARIVEPPGRLRVYAASASDERRAALLERGVDVCLARGPDGRVDIGGVLAALAADGVNELHVEAGPTLNGAFIAGGWADELLVYVAPMLLGQGRPMAAFGPPSELAAAPRFTFTQAQAVGADIRLIARRAGV